MTIIAFVAAYFFLSAFVVSLACALLGHSRDGREWVEELRKGR